MEALVKGSTVSFWCPMAKEPNLRIFLSRYEVMEW